MKKNFILCIFFCSLLFSCKTAEIVINQGPDNGEYFISLCDEIEVGTSRAFECVAVIAYLAGFDEYSRPAFSSMYDSYFDKYKNDKTVKKAVNKFKALRWETGFSYNAVASLGTYLESDCHSYRVPEKILIEQLDKRISDRKVIDDLLKVVSEFYDATSFAQFYENNKKIYKQLTQVYVQQQDFLKRMIDNYTDYYHEKPNKIRISSSYITGNGNYGMSFNDGNKVYFEPKFCVQNDGIDANLLIHEISHPLSNPVAEKIVENTVIYNVIEKTLVSEKLDSQRRQGYGNTYTYIIELLNRANTICICKNFCSDEEIQYQTEYDKNNCYFEEIEKIIEILGDYAKGDYKNLMEFEPELERRWAEIY